MAAILEFDLPTEEFALEETLTTVPGTQIEIERVVADDPDRIRRLRRYESANEVLHDISAPYPYSPQAWIEE